MTGPLARDLIAQHGSAYKAAKAIAPNCRDRYGNQPTINAIRQWILEANDNLNVQGSNSRKMLDPAVAEKINQLLNVLEEANIPPESITIDHAKVRAGFHEVVTKGPDGEPVITRARTKNASIVISPSWKEGPSWPLVQPAKPVLIKNPTTTKKKSTDHKTVVVLSDVQVGFLRDIEDPSNLVPMHDEAAIDVALQIVADLKPNQLGYVGDFLDLNEMSRWLQVEEFWRTTQPAIDTGYRILAQFEAAAGPDREPTQFLSGNHDRRIREYIVKNARAAYNLRPAAETPESWPDLTVPRLLRFEDLGIQYVGEYPGGEWWITPKLVVRHNPEKGYDASVIAGHTHHVSRETFSRRDGSGREFYTLYEIGCLCSLDNYADKRSLMMTRVPSNRAFVRDWAHGFAVVTVHPDGSHEVEIPQYVGAGRASFRGKLFTASPTPPKPT